MAKFAVWFNFLASALIATAIICTYLFDLNPIIIVLLMPLTVFSLLLGHVLLSTFKNSKKRIILNFAKYTLIINYIAVTFYIYCIIKFFLILQDAS